MNARTHASFALASCNTECGLHLSDTHGFQWHRSLYDFCVWQHASARAFTEYIIHDDRQYHRHCDG